MFEGDLDELGTADLLAAASEFSAVEERAAVRKLEAALAYADRNAVVYGGADGEPLPGTEQIKVYGGAGCPGVAEFAPIEFGAVMRMSTGAAASLMGEALALRHRLPRIWAAVLAGNAVSWRARKVARACLSLSEEAAAIVDRRVVGIVNTVTPSKLATIVKAAVWEADPELAKAQADAAAKERGVYVGPSDDHGTKRFWVRAAAGDVIRFDATIDDLAQALQTLGDTDPVDMRRAKAIGWIADPAAAHHLLEVARYLARIRPHITTDEATPAAAAPADAAADDAQAADDADDAEAAVAADDADAADDAQAAVGTDDAAAAQAEAAADESGEGAAVAHDCADASGQFGAGSTGQATVNEHPRTAKRSDTGSGFDSADNARSKDSHVGCGPDDWDAGDRAGSGDNVKPATATRATDQASSDQASEDQAAADQACTNQACTNQAAADQACTNQAAADQACTNQAAADQAGADQAGADHACTNQADADQAGTDQAAGSGDRGGPLVDPDHPSGDTRTPCLAADGGPVGGPGPDDWHLVPEPPDPNSDPGPDDWCDRDRGASDDGGASGAVVGGDSDSHGDVYAFTRQMMAGSLPERLAAIKQHAYSHGLGADSGRRGNRHTLYVHLTDTALATGNGVLRVEELGPLLLSQLSELLGHDRIVVKPVIDLRDQISVHSYEIPDRIRERVRLRYPVDMFPYSAAEATIRMDQDHIVPYDRAGPPGQTSTDNLIPQGRLHHRAKTFGGWRCRRLPAGAIEWISPHGFRFHVDHTGTHPIPPISTAEGN